MSNQMLYRSEIDGLRAIAVLPVILYHAGFNLFEGGFVGVDVFFVISGYLITNIIITEMEDERFSIARFYERRARRILPALFLVILVCIPFAWIWIPPEQFGDFLKSIAHVSIFASNFYFWTQSGYFEPASELVPLLHTWSLSVEEQYYLIFPIFLMLIWNLGKKLVFTIIFIVLLISVGLSEWGWRNAPEANFYLSYSRFWELLAGSLCAFFLFRKKVHRNNYFSTLGLLLIIFSIFYFDKKTPFPSFYTLTPVLGSVFIILFGSTSTFVAKLLSLKPLVGIGLISYSAYLWHYPLFVFARIRSIGDPNEYLMMIIAPISFTLAYLSWQYVEKPFRKPKKPIGSKPNKAIVISLITLSLFFIGANLQRLYLRDFQKTVFATQIDPEVRDLYDFIKRHTTYKTEEYMVDNFDCVYWAKEVNQVFLKRFSRCISKGLDKAVLVLGDSHAMNIYNALAKADYGKFLVGITKGGCRPHDQLQSCNFDRLQEFVKDYANNIDHIVFHQSGSYLISDLKGKVNSDEAFKGNTTYTFHNGNIEKTLNFLDKLSILTKVVWLGPFAEARTNFDYRQVRINTKFNPYSLIAFTKLDKQISTIISQNIHNFNFLAMNPMLKTLGGSLIVDDCFLVKDKDHFSRCGEVIIGKLIIDDLQQAVWRIGIRNNSMGGSKR